jgi:hypothetical protein
MNTVNYNETLVIPILQKKVQELQNANLALEVSLIVEQTKNKDLIATYQKDVSGLSEKDKIIVSLKDQLKNQVDLQNEVIREKSLKDNAISEFNKLKSEYETLQMTINKKKKQEQ